jgi:hypothetical protein
MVVLLFFFSEALWLNGILYLLGTITFFVVSVCLTVYMEQLGSLYTDLHDIL